MIIVYHNPRCRKSRECLAFLQHCELEFKVVNYLETPLSFNELEKIIKKLGINPLELIRKKETIWIANFKGIQLSDKELIQAMIDYPILMERPIAVCGTKAVIARPIERIKEIL